MGDRTRASVTINKDYYPIVINKLTKVDKDFYEVDDYGDVVEFVDYQANYGNMDEFDEVLVELKIPFNHEWDNGGEYSQGQEFVRFNKEGGVERTEYYGESPSNVNGEWILADLKGTELTRKEIIEKLEAELEESRPYKNQHNLTEIPLTRELTEEECALVMQWKLEGSKL